MLGKVTKFQRVSSKALGVMEEKLIRPLKTPLDPIGLKESILMTQSICTRNLEIKWSMKTEKPKKIIIISILSNTKIT